MFKRKRVLGKRGGVVHVKTVGRRRESLALGDDTLGSLGGDRIQRQAVERTPEARIDLVGRGTALSVPVSVSGVAHRVARRLVAVGRV